ncbi:MAG: hypothetical protein H0U76_07835 [Ktedonobacteraceae bacterium]|nr:hypothetical protein [Ktedonobacteraceae bacterium]
MPKRAQHSVNWSSERANYVWTSSENSGNPPLLKEEEGWLKWVSEHSSFAFHGRGERMNLLKEKRSRGGEGYWYAYQRRGGRMVKRYAGRSEQLSLAYLEEVAALLSKEADEEKERPSFHSGPVSFEQLLMPKLQLPRPQKSLLRREPLLDLLNRSLEYKLTIIAGPAGYGKTTLIGQWLAEQSTSANAPSLACITLDEGDNDPIRFWHYIITACQQLSAESYKEALELLLAHRLPPFKPLGMMLTSLLNELSRLEHPAVLVLDDVHVVSSPQVIESLTFFLDHLPTSLHLILLIRGDTPFSLTRLRASNKLLDIYPPSLAFSLEDTTAFFAQELSYSLPPNTIRQIYERMDGWPTGLRLLARDLQGVESALEIEQKLAAFTGSHWSIQDYFLKEVLSQLAPEQQEFLLQTSILPRFTAPLCDAITGRTDSAFQLTALRGGDLFLVPLDGIGEWTRYVSLFAEAMQQEARRRLGDERLHQFAARASIWYEKHNFLVEAIETALNAAEFSRAASLIERFSASREQGNVSTIPELYSLNRWLEQLPPEELEHNPDLCIQYALTLLFLQSEGQHLPGGRESIYHLLQNAEEKWRDANNTAKLAEVFAFRSLLTRQDGHLLQAITWAKQSLAWLPQESLGWRHLSLSVVGIGEILGGNLKNGWETLLQALALAERQGNRIYARAIRGMLAWVTMEQGELRSAAAQFRQMQAEARAQGDRDDIARTQLGLAQIAFQWNNLEDAEQRTREALAIGEQMNEEEVVTRAIAFLALIEHAQGQSAQAMQRLTARLARGQASPSPASYQLYRELQVAQASIQLAISEPIAVKNWLGEQREEMLPLIQRQREQVLHARLLLSQSEAAAAIDILQSLDITTLQTGHSHFRHEIQVVLILAHSRQGTQEKAQKLLRELLEMTRSEGYLRLFLDEGQELADLLRKLLPHLREKVLLAHARQILNSFAAESDASISRATSSADFLPESLSFQERKVLHLLAAGNSNAEIARELVVSVNTVRTQVQSIYRKLNVNNRVEASTVASQLELR